MRKSGLPLLPKTVARALGELSLLERLVLEMRFGVDLRTPEAIATQLGLPLPAVRRIERNALLQLRLRSIGLMRPGGAAGDHV